MPIRPKKQCGQVGCAALTDRKSGYCMDHERVAIRLQDTGRPSSRGRGYGRGWYRVRAAKLQANPICEVCLIDGLVTHATLVHHRDGNAFNNNIDNLQSLCRLCHSREHRSEKSRDMAEIGML